MMDKPNYKGNNGCCLDCVDAEPGCLCYDCKCKKCYYYIETDLIDMNLVDASCGYKFKNKFKDICIILVRKYLHNLIRDNDNHKFDYEYKRFIDMGLIPLEEQVD